MNKKVLVAVVAIFGLLFSFQTGILLVESQTEGTIYILADGSISPSSTPIVRLGDVYTFTNNIVNTPIIIQKDNITVDGAGFALQDTPSHRIAISIVGRTNVTVENLYIVDWGYGINVTKSSYTVLKNNTISTRNEGILLFNSSFNQISENRITSPVSIDAGRDTLGIDVVGNASLSPYHGVSNWNNISANVLWGLRDGIWLPSEPTYSVVSWNNVSFCVAGMVIGSNNTLFANNVFNTVAYAGSSIGIVENQGTGLFIDSFNQVYGNNITGNGIGLRLYSDNFVYGNNFENNSVQVGPLSNPQFPLLHNVWDNGTFGNSWSDYFSIYPNAKEVDNSGTGDTPYVIDSNNTDYHPLLNQISTEQASAITLPQPTPEPSPTQTIKPSPSTSPSVSVPEFPTWTALPLIAAAMLLTVLLIRRKITRDKIYGH